MMKTLALSRKVKRRNRFDIDKYDFFFFDFDGVIVDSEPIKKEGFAAIYKEYGKDIVDKVIRHHQINSGMDRYRKFKFYHKEFLNIELNADEINRLAKRYSEIVFEKVLKASYIKGAPQFLSMCKNNKKISFLVSATPEEEIKKIIKKRGLTRFFKSIKGSPRLKENNIQDLIKKHRVDRRRAVFLGDSVNDLRAANCNKISFIGINYSGSKINYRNFSELLLRSK